LENLKQRDLLKNVGIAGRIVLGWILGKWVEKYGLDDSGLGKGTVVVDSCEHSNEPLGSIKGEESFD
jgi:hypothetical protein